MRLFAFYLTKLNLFFESDKFCRFFRRISYFIRLSMYRHDFTAHTSAKFAHLRIFTEICALDL